MILPSSPFLYPIIDSAFSTDLLSDSKAALRAGAQILQIRAKKMKKAQLFAIVNELVPAAQEQNAILIVNDHIDIALLTGSSGVHLGQDDFPVCPARLLMPEKIIGISTHNMAQLNVANTLPVDYIAIGPIYRSTTKPHAGITLGTTFVEQARRLTNRRLVCIGGIDHSRFPELVRAGADGIAVISALYSKGIYDSISELSGRLRAEQL